MIVTSATQTQYISSVSKTQNEETSYEEVAQKKQSTRYEVLMGMNYDNMSEAEKKERFHYFAMRPMPFLDEEGNKALNKSLEGKTDIEKSQIKSVLQLSFMTSVKVNHDNHTVDRQKFDSIDTSKSATVDRFEKFMEDFPKNGSIDNIGLMDVMDKFLNIYKASDPSTDIKNQENSVVDKFLDDLYSKGSTVTASAIIKETIQNKVNEYAQVLMESKGDTPKSESEISKMLIDYKKELLEDYKKSLDGAENDNMTLEQQGIIKVLLEENTQEASSLEKLLVNQKEK